MIGQATARLEQFPRRWIQTLWGHGDIDMRQKWWAVWPHLARNCRRRSLESARCRLRGRPVGPRTGGAPPAVASPGHRSGSRRRFELAETRAAAALASTTSRFVQCGLLHVRAGRPVRCRAGRIVGPYLAEQGDGLRLFETYARWLKPGGQLDSHSTRGGTDAARFSRRCLILGTITTCFRSTTLRRV